MLCVGMHVPTLRVDFLSPLSPRERGERNSHVLRVGIPARLTTRRRLCPGGLERWKRSDPYGDETFSAFHGLSAHRVSSLVGCRLGTGNGAVWIEIHITPPSSPYF